MTDDQTVRILEAIGAMRSEILGAVRSEMRSELEALEAKLFSVRAEIMARIDRLQDVLTLGREADIVTFGAPERAEKIAKATREEINDLGSQLGALTRLVNMMQSRLAHLEGRDGAAPPA